MPVRSRWIFGFRLISKPTPILPWDGNRTKAEGDPGPSENSEPVPEAWRGHPWGYGAKQEERRAHRLRSGRVGERGVGSDARWGVPGAVRLGTMIGLSF